ncbi:cyclic AMP receptor-like protein A [Styela clava]|uniref:cyclic AMP receptor 4-like n=1 Tax=Styela clava TaxID=7725 RepID=UPI001939BB1A|nr:cyclic AMP receptor 4-like [Styela clava]
MSTNCTLFGGDEHKCSVIIGLKRGFGTLSLIGCLFMIGTIWLFRKYQVKAQQLILCLSIAAFFDTIGYMIGDMTKDGPLCDFEAWWMTYFDWTVLAWTSCITFNLYRMLTRQEHTPHWYFHFVSWIFPPLVLSLLPLIGDNYGPAGAWCWIKHDSVAWRFVIWYVPLFLILIFMIILWGRTLYLHKRSIPSWQGGQDTNAEMMRSLIEDDMKTLIWYPLVYLVLSFFPLILRIHNAATDQGQDIYFLWIMTAITAPLQGACNAIVFGLDPETKSKLTWLHIRMAWASRFSQKDVIQEYTVENDSTAFGDSETRASGASSNSENVPYGSIEGKQL